MTEIRKKFIVALIPILGVLIWTFIIMINSFETEETMRIVFSIVGFTVFFMLNSLLLGQWWREERDGEEE